MSDRDEMIRRRAYALWEIAGRPDGQEKEHWEQAVREMAPGEAGDADGLDTSSDQTQFDQSSPPVGGGQPYLRN
ncbi:hypothetical protein LPJGGPFB_05145 [Ensifer adhaerens]|uniref:DUF2934 domain-containing protein n=1 Tax=Ensifer adhaerens TaxID=106592 RepID=UPI00156A4E3E|nr:hypothetical protein [Ensifer adhaerens]